MFKSVVKVCGSTVKLQLILSVLSTVEVSGSDRYSGEKECGKCENA